MLGGVFDSDGLLCKIMDEIEAKLAPGISLPCGAFDIDVFLDKPTDVAIPAAAQDVVDVRLRLGEKGQLGQIRIVAGIDVEHTTLPGFDQMAVDYVRVNLADKIYHVSATLNTPLGPIVVEHDILTNVFRGFKSLPLLPILVNRNSSDPTQMSAADAIVIDDKTGLDKDALAILLTFGGGTAGNRQQFSKNFLSPNDGGGVAISFDWLCRIIRPKIAGFFKVPDDYFAPPCHLVTPFRVDEGEEVDLTALELSLENQAIQISTSGTKNGTGYWAEWQLSGSITLEVKDGKLIFKTDMAQPQVQTHVDWWVYLLAAVGGAVAGAVAGGPIGALVGAALGPIIVEVVRETIEDKITDIVERVRAIIQTLNLEVPATYVNMIFDSITLDDIIIGTKVNVQDTTPVKASGEILVANNQRFDLETGAVGGEELCGADIVFEGEGYSRQLRTLCEVSLARTWETSFDNFNRLKLYSLGYVSPDNIPLSELAKWPGFGEEIFDYKYKESALVFGVRTDDDRYALMQVTKVDDDYIRVKYKTYDKPFPQVSILGTFKPLAVVSGQVSKGLLQDILSEVDATVLTASGQKFSLKKSGFESSIKDYVLTRKRNANVTTLTLHSSSAEGKSKLHADVERSPESPFKISVRETTTEPKVGVFQARTVLLKRPIKFEWFINKKPLEKIPGKTKIQKLALKYKIEDDRIRITNQNDQAATFLLSVVATDKELKTASASRCIEFATEFTAVYTVMLQWAAVTATYFKSAEIVPSTTPMTIKKPS